MLQPPGAAPNTATWTMNVPSAGTYNVYARWTAYPNRASDAKFTINAASGSSTVTVNQQDGAGGQWNLLGTYSFNVGAATVSLTDQANGYVIADAVMLLPPGAPPNSAIWTPNVAQAGTYQMYAWWTAASNRATNATYTVTNAQGSTAVPVNQQANGGTWNLLGTFSLSPGTTDTITLTDQANGYVIADAIRLVPVQVQTQTKLYFIEVDHLNTPRVVEDATQQVVWRWDQQEPFGANPANDDPDGDSVAFTFPMRFPGQYADAETSLLHNAFRDYDSASGRYVEPEPLGLAVEISLYRYSLSNPLAVIDEDGRAPKMMFGRNASYGVSATLPIPGIFLASLSLGGGFTIRQCCSGAGKVVNQWLFSLRAGVGVGGSVQASASGRGVAPLLQVGGFPKCVPSLSRPKYFSSVDIVAGPFSSRYDIENEILYTGIAGGGGLSGALNLIEKKWVFAESKTTDCCKPRRE